VYELAYMHNLKKNLHYFIEINKSLVLA